MIGLNCRLNFIIQYVRKNGPEGHCYKLQRNNSNFKKWRKLTQNTRHIIITRELHAATLEGMSLLIVCNSCQHILN